MNALGLQHVPQSSDSYATGPNTLCLRLRAARGEAVDVQVLYANKYEWTKARHTAQMKRAFQDALYDYFLVTITPEDTRLAYIFILTDAVGNVFYFSEAGLQRTYDFAYGYLTFFQFPYINVFDIRHRVDWVRRSTFYQVFVERFAAGQSSKDRTYINLNWGEIPTPKSMAGGDLDGITEKLNYIQGLGFSGLYLTPVFVSPSNHKYDTVDYTQVDAQFGGNEALRRLSDAVHARGMRLVLDAVFNHTSWLFEPFQDVIKHGRASRYWDWFFIDGDHVDTKAPNYKRFGDVAYMPKLNTENPEVEAYLLDIAESWTRTYGIDGWRLDVSDEVSHGFWRAFHRRMKGISPDIYITGENWHDAGPWLRGDEFDGILHYAFTKTAMDFFIFENVDAQGLADNLSALLMRYSDVTNDMMLNLLDSHDTHRFITLLDGNKRRLRCALALLYCHVGTPMVYYGTEVGLEGGYDPDCRRTFPWDEAKWDASLQSLVRELNALRKLPVMQEGAIALDAEEGVFVLRRMLGGQEVTLCINRQAEARTAYGVVLAPESFGILLDGKPIITDKEALR